MKDAPEYLKRERLRRGWTLQDASDRTRINITVLRALESGKSSELGSPLSVGALISRYSAALGIETGQREAVQPETGKSAGASRMLLHILCGLVIGALLAVVCLGIVFRHSFYPAKPSAGHHATTSAEKHAPPASVIPKVKRPKKAPQAPEAPKAPKAQKKAPAVSPAPGAVRPEVKSKGARPVSPTQAAPPASVVPKVKSQKTVSQPPETPKAEKKAPAVSPAPNAAGPEATSKGAGPVSPTQAAPPASVVPKVKSQKTVSQPPETPKAEKKAPVVSPAPGAAGPEATSRGGMPISIAHHGAAVSAYGKQALVPVSQPAPGAGSGSAAVSSKPAPQEVPALHSLEIAADGKAWIQVTIDGRKTDSALLQPGQIRQWRAAEKVYLIVGNAGGVHIMWDGKPVIISRTPGRVVRLSLSGN